MTRGALIFAQDSKNFKYSELAAWSALRIERHLSVPVTIITDQQAISNGSRVFGDISIPWKNLGRCLAYQLSPYDQTIVLDADYVVCSNQLATLFGSTQDILCMRQAYDVTARRNYDDLNYFGRHHMPSAWATVMYFRRSHAAELIFDMMQMIQDHWYHYKNLYGITERRFRNDYALAIASNTVYGHIGKWPTIPWTMANLESDCELEQLDLDVFDIRYADQTNRIRRCRIASQDFHAMGKTQLGAIVGSSS
jgi:hypothetical protein